MAVQDPQVLPTVQLSSDLEKDPSVVEVTPLDDRRLLIQSPYTEKGHQLDLDTLDNENESLARALTILTATRQDYATASYNDSFNWPEVIDELRYLVKESGRGFKETTFYIVAFRSQIKPSTDYSHLGQLDKAAHKEAIDSGGFLK
jgi:hypothetical protein